MSERAPGGEQAPITDEQVLENPDLWTEYRNQAVARIKAKETVLMLRNPDGSSDMEPGVIRDYYIAGKHIGYIDCDDDAKKYIPYRPGVGDEEGPQRLSQDVCETLNEAQKALEDYVKGTVQ